MTAKLRAGVDPAAGTTLAVFAITAKIGGVAVPVTHGDSRPQPRGPPMETILWTG